jgi:chromate reductase
MSDLNILAISGSLRKGSYNSMLAHAAVSLAPDGMTIEVYDRLGDIPPFNGDLDTDRPPESVVDLQARIGAAEGLLIATPEYNYSIPGVLKNALDWASRPTAGPSVLTGKAIALMGAAPTNFGTVRAQLALRQMFVWTDSRVVVKPELLMFQAHERFDASGRLVDEASADLLRALLGALADVASAQLPRSLA